MGLLPPVATDISALLQFVMIIITASAAFIGMKIKIDAKIKEPAEKLEKRIYNNEDENSISRQLSGLWRHFRDLETRVNSNEKDIVKLDERSKKDGE